MILAPYDVRKLTNYGGYKKSENLCLLEEFIESGHECAEVKNFTHSSAASCMSSLSQTIKANRMNTIKVMTRQGRVFLVKSI